MRRTAAAVSAILLLSGAAAFAGGTTPSVPANAQATGHGPCVADAQRFCSDVPYGNGRRVDCLARHEKDLAPACKPRVKLLQAMIAYGKKQHERTMATIARMEAEAAKQKAAAAKKPVPPPAPK
jgi:hypothetical protein